MSTENADTNNKMTSENVDWFGTQFVDAFPNVERRPSQSDISSNLIVNYNLILFNFLLLVMF